jgi:hypothetical protein
MTIRDGMASRSLPLNSPSVTPIMPPVLPPYNVPHTPRELRCAIPFRLRSRELLPQFFPPLPLPLWLR